MSMPSNQALWVGRASIGKSAPVAALRPVDQDTVVLVAVDQDDVALDDVLVQGVRMADLDVATLVKGSAAWNAATAYALRAYLPHAAGHFEGLAREWAALANADIPAGSTSAD